MMIRTFRPEDEAAVISLWDRCGLLRPWNDPKKDIQRKLAINPDQFLVGVEDESIIAATMIGYDGHRGWIYYLAVDPDRRRTGLGRQLLDHAEALLRQLGCPKINLQVRTSNLQVIEFYKSIGFVQDEVVSFGKRLEHDGPGPNST